MLENTIENKNKFILQYYGQEVLNTQGDTLSKVGYDNWNLGHKDFFLELTPLSQITDEDAIEVFKIYYMDHRREGLRWNYEVIRMSSGIDVKCWLDGELAYRLGISGNCLLQAGDYLRSKSYLIPYNGTPTETLIEYGWAVIKN